MIHTSGNKNTNIMKNYIFLIILFTGFIIFQTSRTYGQGDALCAGASPFCTGTTYNFPLNTGTSSQSGPDYGCLGSQPNPVWYYLQIDQSGDITVFMQSTPGVYDVDFICWGPFTSATSACTAGLTSGNTIDCSYSTSDQEECNISNAKDKGVSSKFAGNIFLPSGYHLFNHSLISLLALVLK